MNKIKFFIGAMVLLLSGCIPSVHPLYSDDVLRENTHLIGAWSEEEDDRWSFEEDGDGYYLTHYDGKNYGYFEVYLVQLGNNYYFDFYPDHLDKSFTINQETVINDMLGWHLLPVHTFAKVNIEKDKLVIWMFDPDWLDDLLDKRMIRIKHETHQEDGHLITASTQELQKFVIKYGDLDEAFVDPITLHRRT
jgi:hypothetical protein